MEPLVFFAAILHNESLLGSCGSEERLYKTCLRSVAEEWPLNVSYYSMTVSGVRVAAHAYPGNIRCLLVYSSSLSKAYGRQLLDRMRQQFVRKFPSHHEASPSTAGDLRKGPLLRLLRRRSAQNPAALPSSLSEPTPHPHFNPASLFWSPQASPRATTSQPPTALTSDTSAKGPFSSKKQKATSALLKSLTDPLKGTLPLPEPPLLEYPDAPKAYLLASSYWDAVSEILDEEDAVCRAQEVRNSAARDDAQKLPCEGEQGSLDESRTPLQSSALSASSLADRDCDAASPSTAAPTISFNPCRPRISRSDGFLADPRGEAGGAEERDASSVSEGNARRAGVVDGSTLPSLITLKSDSDCSSATSRAFNDGNGGASEHPAPFVSESERPTSSPRDAASPATLSKVPSPRLPAAPPSSPQLHLPFPPFPLLFPDSDAFQQHTPKKARTEEPELLVPRHLLSLSPSDVTIQIPCRRVGEVVLMWQDIGGASSATEGGRAGGKKKKGTRSQCGNSWSARARGTPQTSPTIVSPNGSFPFRPLGSA